MFVFAALKSEFGEVFILAWNWKGVLSNFFLKQSYVVRFDAKDVKQKISRD